LPHAVGMALAQDGDGFIWIGTQSGLGRWDGYADAQLFSRSPAIRLPCPMILSRRCTSTQQGRLWIGTAASGLAMYDKDQTETLRTLCPARMA
jgi:ligand-binding sensor domain-containing protein